MISCEEFSSLLELTTQGKASQAQQAEMKEHAQTCVRCSALLDLSTLYAEVEVPQTAKTAWRAALRAQEAEKPMETKKNPIIPWRRYAAIAAAAVFLVVGAASVHNADLSGKKNQTELSADYEPETAQQSPTNFASYSAEDNAAADGAQVRMLTSGAADEAQSESKIIKTASLTVKTQAFEEDLLLLKNAAINLGGRVDSERESGDKAQGALRSASLTLRIPSEKLEEFLSGAQGVAGRVISSSQTQEDVTESYTDIAGRLKSQQAKLERLRELMSQATTVSDLIEIENATTDAQYMVDYYTGQINHYDSQISLSTVEVSVREETSRQAAEATEVSFGTRVKNGLAASWENVKTFVSDAGVFLIIAAPWLVLAGVVVGGITLSVKKKRAKGHQEK